MSRTHILEGIGSSLHVGIKFQENREGSQSYSGNLDHPKPGFIRLEPIEYEQWIPTCMTSFKLPVPKNECHLGGNLCLDALVTLLMEPCEARVLARSRAFSVIVESGTMVGVELSESVGDSAIWRIDAAAIVSVF